MRNWGLFLQLKSSWGLLPRLSRSPSSHSSEKPSPCAFFHHLLIFVFACIAYQPATVTMTNDLVDAAKAHLKEKGWVRIPSVLSKDEAASALDRLWKAKEATEKEGEDTYVEFLDPNPKNIRIFCK